MGFFTFEEAVNFLKGEGYLLIFILMAIEGPITTTAAAFLSAAGIFNIYFIFILSVFADLFADLVYYFMGRCSNKAVVERYIHKSGKSKMFLEKVETGLNSHLGKTMFAIKMTPFFAVPGLILTGALKIPVGRFAKVSLLITLPRTIFLVLVGFYFGYAVDKILHYFEIGQYIFLFLIIAVVIVYFALKIINSKIQKRVKI